MNYGKNEMSEVQPSREGFAVYKKALGAIEKGIRGNMAKYDTPITFGIDVEGKSIRELGVDSMGYLDVVLELEGAFEGIDLDLLNDAEVSGNLTVEQLAEYVARKVEGKATK